jgi:hypothetical protein
MSDNHHTEQQRERAAPMGDQGLPPSGQQFERKKQYRARGCRGGAYRKGRTQRSASYNMRSDQERRGRLDDASAHQENDPYHPNRHHTSYYPRHNNYHHRHQHHHRNQNYHGRPHPSNFIKKEPSDHSHDAKFRTLSILPDGEDVHLEGDEPTCPSDDVVATTAADDKADSSPNVLAPILPNKSSDSTAAAPLAESTVVPQTAVMAPISKNVAKESGVAVITKQAACNFSFFALSPSSFLTGKKAKNGHSYF